MATITMGAAASNNWIGDVIQPTGAPLVQTATQFKFATTTGHVVTLVGTGFTYTGPGGAPNGGVITTAVITKAGQQWFGATGLSVDFQDAFYTFTGWDEGNGNFHDGDSFDVFSLITQGNDTINGSNANDDLIAGRNAGNDTMRGFGGNDYLKSSAGNNILDGGNDFDRLTYQESFFDQYAFRGANVDLAAGTGTNSWGGTDTIVAVEAVQGSRFVDVLLGDANNNDLEGLRGTDTLNGRGGFDLAIYDGDNRFGGSLAIKVNLGTQAIIDGWGNKDTVIGIEAVLGTKFNDVFIGDGVDNTFIGWMGKDAFNGGGGAHDRLAFWRNDFDSGSPVGVVVNLSLASNRVVNDGFGNVENAVNIEDLAGSKLGDTLTGDGLANFLRGEDGNDTLAGAGGDDRLLGGRGQDTMVGGGGLDDFIFENINDSPSGGTRDRITDFQVGADDIVLRDIPGLTFVGAAAFTGANQVRFVQQANGAGTADDRTIVQVTTNANPAPEMEIELFGLKTLVATDFVLI